MQIIDVTATHYVPRVSAFVAVVFIVKRLGQVADEMYHEFEGLGTGSRELRFGIRGRCRAERRSASG
jgi:hypothetical protein